MQRSTYIYYSIFRNDSLGKRYSSVHMHATCVECNLEHSAIEQPVCGVSDL